MVNEARLVVQIEQFDDLKAARDVDKTLLRAFFVAGTTAHLYQDPVQ